MDSVECRSRRNVCDELINGKETERTPFSGGTAGLGQFSHKSLLSKISDLQLQIWLHSDSSAELCILFLGNVSRLAVGDAEAVGMRPQLKCGGASNALQFNFANSLVWPHHSESRSLQLGQCLFTQRRGIYIKELNLYRSNS